MTCNYKSSAFWAATTMYNCFVSNSLDIYQPEDAEITTVTGTHFSEKSSDSEVVFYSYNRNVHFFPKGLEKIYKNLNGIILYTEPINFIQQSDLKYYTKIIFLQLADTKIEILEDGLFDYNPLLKYLALNENKIFHIGLTVFDKLDNLVSLYLQKNVCINEKSENSKSGVADIIQSARRLCMSTEFFGLDEKFLKLEEEAKKLSYKNLNIFKKKVQSLESQFIRSKFGNFTLLQEKLEKLKEAAIMENVKADDVSGASMTHFGLILLILCSFLVKLF